MSMIQTDRYTLHCGDCLEIMRELPENSVDSVICDPPYGLGSTPDMAEVLGHWLNGDDYEHRGGGFMGRSWDAFVPGPSVWREAYRVAKPGATLLAFGGTRTADLLSIAIRLAGWERFDELQWIYGSGFPKSLAIDKAIDRAAGVERRTVGKRPYTNAKMDAGRGVSGLKQSGSFAGEYDGERVNVPITAPSTAAAQQWAGWGTAMKPAHEPVLFFHKSFTDVPKNGIMHELNNLLGGALCLLLSSVKDAEKVLALNPVEQNVALGFAAISVALLNGARSGALYEKMDMFNSPETVSMCLNIAMLWSSTLGAHLRHGSTFTTRTETVVTIGLRTLKSLLLTTMPESIIRDAWKASGYQLNAMDAESHSTDAERNGSEQIATIVRWIATEKAYETGTPANNAASALRQIIPSASIVLSNVLTEILTESSELESSILASIAETNLRKSRLDRPSTAIETVWQKLSPNSEPILCFRKPVEKTFAHNALTQGVAGLWIDGCRVPTNGRPLKESTGNTSLNGNSVWGGKTTKNGSKSAGTTTQGRWPANLILDDEAAALLDELSGERPTGKPTAGKKITGGIYGDGAYSGVKRSLTGGGDTGGASRYFTRIHYSPKASKRERNEGLPEGIENRHPTVKPLSLMQYLCRLTKTPTGGVVLDPFMGSGTTGVAALLEGREFIGIEMERESFETARHRIEHAASQAVQPELF